MSRWKKWILTGIGILLFIFLVTPFLIIEHYKSQVYSNIDSVPHTTIAIVFGAGIYQNNTPRDMLRDRLTVVGELYQKGLIKKILVSGDNRFENYNEPAVMKNYLTQTYAIPEEDIFSDYAGRSTYETCARATSIFGVSDAILITQGYHLPRAIFTCSELGIASHGISATLQSYRQDTYFKFREIFAIYKAMINIYLFPPPVIGGDLEPIIL